MFLLILLYRIAFSVKNKLHFDISLLIKTFFGAFLQRGTFALFWYFGAMCIIYAVYPILNKIYDDYPRYYCLMLIFIMAIQNIAFIGNVVGFEEQSVIQTFRLWNWITYFMLGGAIKKIRINKMPLIISFLFSSITTLVSMRWLYPYIGNNHCEFFYSYPLVIIMTVYLFKIITQERIHHSIIIENLSKLFLPVYSLHLFIIMGMNSFGKYLESLQLIMRVTYWLKVLCATVALSFIIMRNSFINIIFRI